MTHKWNTLHQVLSKCRGFESHIIQVYDSKKSKRTKQDSQNWLRLHMHEGAWIPIVIIVRSTDFACVS